MVNIETDFTYDASLDKQILDLFKTGASHTKVAVELGLTRTQYDRARAVDQDFNLVCEYGENLSEAYFEQLALDGANGKIKNFNNTILKFLMESRYSGTYGKQKEEEDDSSLLEKLAAGSLKLVRDNQ